MLAQDKITHQETRAPMTPHNRIIYSARIASGSLKTHLENNTARYLFVIVKLEGQITHILKAMKYAINSDLQESHYYLANFLTKPEFIIDADAQGSVRGAGDS
ncbi:hypothetical protein [Yersinia rohdei]|uniref:hypothetical protein n=1 Tax=Yersinia rohdei TaxID=29485 RepID=UPI00067A7F8E|nr:hypothetical protein [Yersinia rohdei]